MIHRRCLAPAVIICVLSMALASTAAGATAPLKSADITLLTEQGRSLLLVAGEVPESVKLPAQIRLSMPAGSELQWAGELMGADPAADIESQPAKTTEDGIDVYTLTLTRSRTGQVEALVPDLVRFDGTTYTTALSWTPLDDVPQVRISARIPATSRITGTPEGETARLFPSDAQYSYFSKTLRDARAGEPAQLMFTHVVGPPAASNASAGGGNDLIPAIILLVAIIAFAFAFLAIRRKMASVDTEPLMDLSETGASDSMEGAPASFDDNGVAAETGDTDIAGGADERERAPRPPRSSVPVLIVAAVVAVAVVAGALAGNRSTTAQNIGGAVTRTFGTSDACTAASIAIKPAAGVDLNRQANALLAGLERIPGIGTVTLFPEEGRIEIGYCGSSATEEQLRAALTATGLVEIAQAGPVPVEPPSGDETTRADTAN